MNQIKLPDKLTIEGLKKNYELAKREYRRAFRRARILDATDKGYMWEAIHAKFPKYQILPDSNHTSYIKNNILASIYTVGKSANLAPTSEEDKDVVEAINMFLDNFWEVCNVGYYQMQAGDRAALLNLGITQVGWDADGDWIGGDGVKGVPVYKNINPLKFMRDPYAIDLDHAGYCITWDEYHKSVIEADSRYKDAFKKYIEKNDGLGLNTDVPTPKTDRASGTIENRSNYYRIFIHWVRVKDKIHEIHTVDNKEVLFVKEDIKPSLFPFALCYCNLPNEDLFGTSEPAKFFANSLAYNMINSIFLTAEFKNQRPPRFVNTQSGLNVQAFAKHGNDADRVFPVNGDASRAVHYQTYPTPSQGAYSVNKGIADDIKSLSGIDGHYTGRDTGSILTTGGIDSMLAQATMIDLPKINLYEEYAKRLTKLTIYNLLEFSAKRSYIKLDPVTHKVETKTVDFPNINSEIVFNYIININSQLPKNKQTYAEKADMLMEKQMQYKQAGLEVDLITPEEWLMFQDFPQREYLAERMNIQRDYNALEDVASTIFNFAEATNQGVPPEEAINYIAQQKRAEQTPGGVMPEPLAAPPAEGVPTAEEVPQMF